MLGLGLGGARRLALAAMVLVAGSLAGGGVAQAALTDSGGAFHGCVGKSGVLRVIKPGHKCKKGEQAITFNQQGRPGGQGQTGATGQTGAQGQTGATGPQGPPADAGEINAVKTRLAALEGTLSGVTRAGSTLTFTGMNLQLQSGSGSTLGAVNGLGNLIIGYNEFPRAQTGSHNLILGNGQSFTSYGGILAGQNNSITAPFASVTGGEGNIASSPYASVTGGFGNAAGGLAASVTGGIGNTASGTDSAILGGNSQSLATRCGTIPAGGTTC